MRRDVLIKALRPLASIAYQRRYIVGGTKDEYVLPDELLETAEHLVKWILSKSMFTADYSEAELNCLIAMQATFKQEGDKLSSGGSLSDYALFEDLVENNAAWAAIRNKAKECLEVFGVNLAEWEEKMETED